MGDYLAQRIIDGAFDTWEKDGMTSYQFIISKKTNLKTEIDAYLTKMGKADLIIVSTS